MPHNRKKLILRLLLIATVCKLKPKDENWIIYLICCFPLVHRVVTLQQPFPWILS